MPLPLIAAGAALNTVGTILTDIPVLGGLLNAHPADAERKQQDDAAYTAALAGGTAGKTAALFLVGRAGHIPPGTCCIAATDTAKQYAEAYVQKLQRGGLLDATYNYVDPGARGSGGATPGGTALSMLGLGPSSAAGISPLVVIGLGVLVLGLVLLRR